MKATRDHFYPTGDRMNLAWRTVEMTSDRKKRWGDPDDMLPDPSPPRHPLPAVLHQPLLAEFEPLWRRDGTPDDDAL
ncbi:MAG TPA: hypothetical protein VEO54_00330 [Thermoanaerobaculia bacterium]|nr:hypothetical protein [Thermoanaerobaculia bacterium]